MDSSGLQSATSTSILSNDGCGKEDSAMIQSRRAEFFANYKRQSFSLPDSVMFYMATNPTSPELYQKMNESCKYFYVKNPILVVPEFSYVGDGKWRLSSGKSPLDVSKISSKFWITDQLLVHPVNPNILSSLMPKLYRCDAKFVSIVDQILSCQDLPILFSSAEDIDFINVTVKEENGSNVGIEKMVEIAANAKKIDIWSDTPLSLITAETMKALIKLPHFSKLDELTMKGAPETFDLETFYAYMKKNKSIKFKLLFDDSVSEAYKNRVEEIVDEIISTETHDYKIPLIDFDGLDMEKWKKLARIYYSHH